MKVNLKGKIISVTKNENNVNVNLEFDGKVDTKSIDAKPAQMHATLVLKPLVANELKLGSIFSLFITDEE